MFFIFSDFIKKIFELKFFELSIYRLIKMIKESFFNIFVVIQFKFNTILFISFNK
jgi:hypothetical protein